MNAYERRIWDLIHPSYLREGTNYFDEPQEVSEAVAKREAELIPDPDCQRCYGRGYKGTRLYSKNISMKSGRPKRQPLKQTDFDSQNQDSHLEKQPIWCQCITKGIKTIERLVEGHNETHRPAEDREDQTLS